MTVHEIENISLYLSDSIPLIKPVSQCSSPDKETAASAFLSKSAPNLSELSESWLVCDSNVRPKSLPFQLLLCRNNGSFWLSLRSPSRTSHFYKGFKKIQSRKVITFNVSNGFSSYQHKQCHAHPVLEHILVLAFWLCGGMRQLGKCQMMMTSAHYSK